ALWIERPGNDLEITKREAPIAAESWSLARHRFVGERIKPQRNEALLKCLGRDDIRVAVLSAWASKNDEPLVSRRQPRVLGCHALRCQNLPARFGGKFRELFLLPAREPRGQLFSGEFSQD